MVGFPVVCFCRYSGDRNAFLLAMPPEPGERGSVDDKLLETDVGGGCAVRRQCALPNKFPVVEGGYRDPGGGIDDLGTLDKPKPEFAYPDSSFRNLSGG